MNEFRMMSDTPGPSKAPAEKKTIQFSLKGMLNAHEQNRPLSSADLAPDAPPKQGPGRPRKHPKTSSPATASGIEATPVAAETEDVVVPSPPAPAAAPPALPPNPTVPASKQSKKKGIPLYRHAWVVKVRRPTAADSNAIPDIKCLQAERFAAERNRHMRVQILMLFEACDGHCYNVALWSVWFEFECLAASIDRIRCCPSC